MMAFLPLVRQRDLADALRMFSAHCPNHGTEVLLSSRNITGMVDTAEGIVVSWRCSCGGEGALLTGRRMARERASLVA